MLILSIGLLWWTTIDNKVEPVIAVQKKPATKQLPSNVKNNNTLAPDVKNLTIETDARKEVVEKKEVIAKFTANIVKKKIIKADQPAPISLKNFNETIAITKIEEPHIDKKINEIEAFKTPQQNLNDHAVTTQGIAAYTTIEASANKSMANFAVATTGNEKDKKGSVRGFLRKASRFIERRTGINPVNEDDELLIGAIAIKL
jgi:hypothetical protein